MKNLENIDEKEFVSITIKEQCTANLSERCDAVAPSYIKYTSQTRELIEGNAYPTWRTNRERTRYIGSFETPPTEAFPISFHELSLLPALFSEIRFNPTNDYFRSKNVITFYCDSCSVRVVKDGNHRLLQCAVQDISNEVTVYEVVSKDWHNCKIDMKNFCKCISSNQLKHDVPKSRRL